MRNPLIAFTIWLCFFYLMVPPSAVAEKSAREAAREHYARGLELIEEELFKQAIVEFERAYQASPNYSVLYNLGMAYVVENKPVQAVDALTRYLKDGKSSVPKRRVTEVEKEIERQKTKIAVLTIRTKPQGARVLIDSIDKGVSPLNQSIQLDAGRHTVEVSLEGYRTQERRVDLVAQEQRVFDVVLEPITQHASDKSIGRLDVQCPVSDVQVIVDKRETGTTPLSEPLLLSSGQHNIAFQRDGYSVDKRRVTVTTDSVASITCDIRQLSNRSSEPLTKLILDVSEPDASVTVDDRPMPDDGRLSEGTHWVRVQHNGFIPWEKEITLKAKEPQTVDIQLVPTNGYLDDYRSSANTMRTIAYIAGAAGLVLAGTTIGLAVYNDDRYNDWKTERDSIAEAMPSTKTSSWDDLLERQSENDELADSISTVDKIAVGTGIAGGTLLVTGVILFFSGDDPGRYDTLVAQIEHDGARIELRTKW